MVRAPSGEGSPTLGVPSGRPPRLTGMERAGTRAPRRSRLGADLAILGLIGVLLLAAIGAGGATLYRQFYGPSAFVVRYLDLLAEGRAAAAAVDTFLTGATTLPAPIPPTERPITV